MPETHADLIGGDVCWQVRSADLRLLNGGSLQIQVSQIATTEIGVSEIGIAEHDPAQIDLTKIRCPEIRAAEVDGISTFDVLVERIDLTNTQQFERGILQESWCCHLFYLDGTCRKPDQR